MAPVPRAKDRERAVVVERKAGGRAAALAREDAAGRGKASPAGKKVVGRVARAVAVHNDAKKYYRLYPS